ncbi:hypothetical protein [Cytophaga hutchinsonii]|uniref:Secreted protein n=1 Tax=Cytophaga hutchinsonii (strain ATCC 33406 / DSM 1761 / CIP 103989 / NBRC 15051 / NCIMB 9469 / D465) TaxID=269798 RepID=A0A6N4ST01_CYTH3|nr:hypothetical protein [Cytophaga hutchinsonii]ABG59417.1 hypothetical protein CHU_2154 [Cytophaga hutchinsonii ATCC 33406]SFY02065.1 hypothetical protein SAMN04487930_1206 [Cytophaga hutchinsonii ATCC 33406]
MNRLQLISAICFLLFHAAAYSQSISADSLRHANSIPDKHVYPEVKGYIALVVPVYTFSSEGNAFNGEHSFVIGNPWGINIWKSKRFGFSFEFTPFLKIDNKENKVSNVLFHPGILYRLGHEYTFIARAAYETSGRYGFTPIINKVLIRTPHNTFYVAALLPVRFGNNHEPSVTPGIQFGIGF